jgi:PAS domain S-box-containing protein
MLPLMASRLFDSNPDLVLILDDDGHIVSINAAALATTGHTAEALIGRPYLELVHPEDRDGSKARFAAALRGEIRHRALRIIRRDGEIRHLDVSSGPCAAQEHPEAILCIAKDVTERVLATQQLMASEAKHRSLFEHSLDGVLLLGPDHRIISANPAACAILGRSEEDLITGSPARIIGLNDPAFRRAVAEQERTGSYRGELWVWRAGSTLLPIDVSANGFEGADGRRYVSVIFRDISERKRAERELETSREETRRLWAFVQSVREAEQKRLARELHDELGQLITALKLDLGWLKRALPAGQTFLEEKVADLEVLIEATLDAQRRLLAGLRPRVLDETGLSAACQWLLQEFQRSSGLNCQLCLSHSEFQLSDALTTAAFRIVQEALTNVARHAHASWVRVSLLQSQERFVVRIADDGRGLAPTPPSSRQSFGLMGIRERAHLLGGELTLSSTPGDGTEVEVSLPLSTELASFLSETL